MVRSTGAITLGDKTETQRESDQEGEGAGEWAAQQLRTASAQQHMPCLVGMKEQRDREQHSRSVFIAVRSIYK